MKLPGQNESVRRLFQITVLLLAAFFLAFLFYARYAREKEERGPKRIICVLKVLDETNDFWEQLLEGAQMAALEYGIELEVVAASQETAIEEQNQLIYWAIEVRPDAILLMPSSQEDTAPAVEKVRESGIPIVLVDSSVNGSEGLTRVATDNVEAGKIQGEFMKKFLTQESQIAIVSYVKGASTAADREKGLREGLGEFEENIVEVVFCDSDYDKAYQLAQELLEKYPQIDMIAGLNEYAAVGAARAVVDKGYEDRVNMVGFDSSMEEIRLLERGVFEGIVIQNPYTMGYMAVEQADRILKGAETEEFVNSGSKLITKEEMYSEENQKILFMFTED